MKNITDRNGMLISMGLIAIAALILLAMGREPICKCGYVKLWHGEVISSENSQHLSDWYTPSHVLHGLLFFALTWLFLRSWSFGIRMVIATCVEITWEIVENTDIVIQHYREATISLDYYGDSVINSVADCLAMLIGFYLARLLPVWGSIALFIIAEAVTIYFIRDGLLLNILMLLWPLEAVKAWQSGN
ncbi:MAG: DUF2585 family protein [Rhizobiaceae bacterium]